MDNFSKFSRFYFLFQNSGFLKMGGELWCRISMYGYQNSSYTNSSSSLFDILKAFIISIRLWENQVTL